MSPVAEVALEIDAPLARVWRIMVDLPNYAAWTPFSGLLARTVPLARVQDGFVRHAAALKAHAEASRP